MRLKPEFKEQLLDPQCQEGTNNTVRGTTRAHGYTVQIPTLSSNCTSGNSDLSFCLILP